MLHYAWPSRSATSSHQPPEPVPARFKRNRTGEPKPFAGFTQRPPCAACEHEAHHPIPAPPRRPDPMPATHRRPCVIDTSMHFCPHDGCDYRGWVGLNNLRANGHPKPNLAIIIVTPVGLDHSAGHFRPSGATATDLKCLNRLVSNHFWPASYLSRVADDVIEAKIWEMKFDNFIRLTASHKQCFFG